MGGLKFGIVEQIDPAKARARVRLDDNESILTYWLAVLQQRTGKDKTYCMVEEGEHVACLLDEHAEEGVIIGAIYSEAEPPIADSEDVRRVELEDGAWFEYDRRTGNLNGHVPGDINITSDGDQTLIGSLIHLNPES